MLPVSETELFVAPDGAKIAYEDHGSGPAIVLVHGHPFDMSMWDEQVAPLTAAGWRVIRFDLRGYGRSQGVPGVTTLTTFAHDVAGLADALGLGRFTLIGLSMGGQVVMEFHRIFADRVAGMVLADTTAAAETTAGKLARNEQADRLLYEGMYPYARDVLTKMIAPDNVVSMPLVAGHVMRMMLCTAPEGAAAALRGRAERPDYFASLAECAVPTLVIAGDADTFTPESDAEQIRKTVRDATLVLVEGAAHMPNIERPSVFNDVVIRFLGSIRSEAR